LAQAKLDAHPVGSLYWSSDPTDPSTLFGGTWVRIKDRFVLAAGDTYTTVPEGNATSGDGVGGSATVQLTESNLPAHAHSFSGTTDGMSGDSYASFGGIDWTSQVSFSYSFGRAIRDNYKNSQGTTDDGHGTYSHGIVIDLAHTHSFSGTTGNGNGTASAIDIMPPYITKYCWERTA
jgi:hypothetical protein